MLNLSETDKAYLAGLFDGEGSIGYYFKTKIGYHIAQVQISNSSPEIMTWLKDKLPIGSISIANCKSHKYINWAWICNSKNQIKEFLEAIRPYLIFKGAQVDLLFSLWNTEQEIGCGIGQRLSKETIALRKATEEQLKSLKTSSYKSVH